MLRRWFGKTASPVANPTNEKPPVKKAVIVLPPVPPKTVAVATNGPAKKAADRKAKQVIKPMAAGDEAPADPNADALAMFQTEMQTKLVDINQDLAVLEKLERDVLASGSVPLEIISTQDNPSMLRMLTQNISKLVEEIKGCVEKPSAYFTDLLTKIKPSVTTHIQEMDAAIAKLKILSGQNADEARRQRLIICNKAIELENAAKGIINSIQAELEYCFKVENLTRLGMITVVSTEIPAAGALLGACLTEEAARKDLFEHIHESIESLDDFINESLGAVERAKSNLQMDSKLTLSNTPRFWSPDIDVRKAANIKDRDAVLTRTVSSPSLR